MLGAATRSRRLFSSGYAMTNRSQRGSVRTEITAYCHIELCTKLLTRSPSGCGSLRGSIQKIEACDGLTLRLFAPDRYQCWPTEVITGNRAVLFLSRPGRGKSLDSYRKQKWNDPQQC